VYDLRLHHIMSTCGRELAVARSEIADNRRKTKIAQAISRPEMLLPYGRGSVSDCKYVYIF
jgi:hypothetical protein